MAFEDLDDTTREHMLAAFEEEQANPGPYRSAAMSAVGLAAFPDLMRDAIRGGTEVSLTAELQRPEFWNPTETWVKDGVTRDRKINTNQAGERLGLTEFNTWYVAGLARRLQAEGQTSCQVYRAAEPKWQHANCDVHDGKTYPLTEIIAVHRAGYWPAPGDPAVFSIPAGPGCHHTIRRAP